MSMFALMRPGSRAFHNICMYIGLAVAAGLTLHHIHSIMHEAKFAIKYDPLGNCLGIYLDSILFFVYFL